MICLRWKGADADALHPVRFDSEVQFFHAKTHERSFSLAEMEAKISAMRDRRQYQRWNSSNPVVAENILKKNRPNILFILADDLGYGDLSVQPFTTPYDANQWPCTEGGILTPRLEQMASEGVILTNFHAAAPVCSPSRAALMTGLYSWRLNAMNAFEVSKEDLTQLNGFLPQVPTTAELLREQGYFTAHSGKWHIGGMREENRKQRAQGDDCTVPGPNQHGFEEYISALDGPESPRYSFLNKNGGLHLMGHRHRIKNDVPMPIVEMEGVAQHTLSDYEAGDAVAFMQQAAKLHPGQPWFIQVWFNAPHGPYDLLLSGEQVYSERYNKTHADWVRHKCRNSRGQAESLDNHRWRYKTMVSAMDRSIGMLLDAVKSLGLEEKTLIVFTSDNGPEDYTGTGGIFREGKRSLLEGGVRVPAICKWKGVIPERTQSSVFAAHTDLLPTFLAAAQVSAPKDLSFDGLSLLHVLTKAAPVPSSASALQQQHSHPPGEVLPGETEKRKLYFSNIASLAPDAELSSTGDIAKLVATNRVHLWHKACDPYRNNGARRQSGGFYEHIKVLASDTCVDRVFDLRHDPVESANLLQLQGRHPCSVQFDSVSLQVLHQALSNRFAEQHCELLSASRHHNNSSNSKAREKHLESDSEEKCRLRYHAHLVKKVGIILSKLIPFFQFGKQGYQNYVDKDARHATCAVPMASQVKRLRYAEGSECEKSKYGCTQPEYALPLHR
jgi:arylsulfatase A